MVWILVLATELGEAVDSHSCKQMSSIKKDPDSLRLFYVYIKQKFNLLIGHPSKVNDKHKSYFYVKIDEAFVLYVGRKYKAEYNTAIGSLLACLDHLLGS